VISYRTFSLRESLLPHLYQLNHQFSTSASSHMMAALIGAEPYYLALKVFSKAQTSDIGYAKML